MSRFKGKGSKDSISPSSFFNGNYLHTLRDTETGKTVTARGRTPDDAREKAYEKATKK